MGEKGSEDSRCAFVAGSTGFTGREVVRILLERGVDTVAHVRPDSKRTDEWREMFIQLGAEVDASEWEESAMAETMSRLRPGYVFALLGTTRARMKQIARAGGDSATGSYETVDYGLTALLVNAAKASGIQPRFVYLSASGTNKKAVSPYYKARYKAEEAVLSSGLDYVIARPPIIGGPGRDDSRPAERVGEVVFDGMLSAAGLFGAKKLKSRFTSITNITLAESLVRFALDPGAANKIYEAENLRG